MYKHIYFIYYMYLLMLLGGQAAIAKQEGRYPTPQDVLVTVGRRLSPASSWLLRRAVTTAEQ